MTAQAGLTLYAVPRMTNDQESPCAAPYTESIPGTVVTFDMVRVPAGEITMPDPAKKGATKTVKVGPFWMGKTEVTWDAYDIFVFRLDQPQTDKPAGKDAITRPSKPYGEADRGYGHKGYPVINESYLGAQAFCKWLSAKTGHKLSTSHRGRMAIRLPGGRTRADRRRSSRPCAVTYAEKTARSARRQPNAWGLYDMLGNVAEWCVDLKGKPVVCGGSFEDKPEKVKATARKYQTDAWQENDPQDPKSKWWLSDGAVCGLQRDSG